MKSTSDTSKAISPCYQEWCNSGVYDSIITANVRWIEDPCEVDELLNRNTKRRWKHSDNLVPGWAVEGVDPNTGEKTGMGAQYKPSTPQPCLDKNGQPILSSDGTPKVQKYLSASGEPVSPLFLEMPDRDYWSKLLGDVTTPILITEGAKKAGSLLSCGYAAISIPGVTTGQKLGRLKPEIEPFCKPGRTVYLCFDNDVMDKLPVQKALDTLGRLVMAVGAVVKVVLLPAGTAKGVDDFIVSCGKQAFQAFVSPALTFEEWRKTWKKDKPNPSDYLEKRVVSDRLIDLVKAAKATLWHTPEEEAFADIQKDGIRRTLPLRSRPFRQWLYRHFYEENNRSATPDAVQQAISSLESLAVYDGDEHPINLRIAEHENRIYLDLGTSDWQAVEVSIDGWRLVSDAPVRFKRENQSPLPIPESEGSVDDLKTLLGMDGDEWLLLLVFILNCFKPQGSYPILILHGEAGAGKSTKSRVIRKLIDPGKDDLLTPRNLADARNLANSAIKRHLLAFDNLSGISSEQSDDLCRLATGGSFTHRALHTDSEEITFTFVKPLILNGIDSIATRGDLLDRAILLSLKRPDKRRSEEEFWAEFDRIYPRVLGALLDLLSQVLAVLPSVELPADCPRMTGYTRIGIATEQVLGLESGKFLAAYQGTRDECHETALEASPIAQSIIELMEERSDWQGSSSELLAELNNRVSEATRKSKSWVSDATRLSKQLTRLAPDLRGVGIEFDSTKSNGKRKLLLENTGKIAPLDTLASKPTQGKGLGRDSGRDSSFKGNSSVPDEVNLIRDRDARNHGRDAGNFADTLLKPSLGEGLDARDSRDAENAPSGGSASNRRDSKSQTYKFWTRIKTSVQILKTKFNQTQIRIPGETNPQWVDSAELQEIER